MVLRPHMRNSTGSPVFSDFQSDLSRVAVSRPLVKGNEDAGYEGEAARDKVNQIAHVHKGTRGAWERRKHGG